jgi:hypothetical protein
VSPIDRMADTHTKTPLSYKEGWDFKAKLGFAYDRRSDAFDASLGLDYLMFCLKKGYSFNAAAAGGLKSRGGDYYQQMAKAAVRFDWRLAQLGESNSLWGSTISTFYHDKPVDVTARGTLGFGPRLLSLWGPVQNDLSVFLIPEYTSYASAEDEYGVRLSFRNTTIIPIGDAVTMGLDAYWVPDVQDFSKFRADVGASLDVKVADWLMIGGKINYAYDTRHEEFGMDPHDLSTQATLTFTTGRKTDTK